MSSPERENDTSFRLEGETQDETTANGASQVNTTIEENLENTNGDSCHEEARHSTNHLNATRFNPVNGVPKPKTPISAVNELALPPPPPNLNKRKLETDIQGGRRVKIYRGNHAPVCPPGTRFTWADNPHVEKVSFKVGVNEKKKLRMKLKASNGKSYTFKYSNRHNLDWNSKHDLANADKWRKQIISRRLDVNEAGNPLSQDTRPKWSETERRNVETLVKSRIHVTKGRLSKADWVVIAEKYNQLFTGQTVKKGDQTPATWTKTKKGEAKVLKPAGVVKKTHRVPSRSTNAIYALAHRWPETIEMMNEETARYNPTWNATGDGEAEGMSLMEDDDVDEEGSDDSDIDNEIPVGMVNRLGGQSDDESGGRRPASNPIGDLLVST